MDTRGEAKCEVGVARGEELLRYSFPPPHPFNSTRVQAFWNAAAREPQGIHEVKPSVADQQSLERFHSKSHVEFVRAASARGEGYLDDGDTPAFSGVYEAALLAVGTTLSCVQKVVDGELDHAFNPVGGLHHATRASARGFCVFNDIGVAVELLRSLGLRRILYVDIDAHHGDGVYYPFESDPDLFIFDVHEDGRFLYPGTGSPDEVGRGAARGTKVNLPLPPGSGDHEVEALMPQLERFATTASPEFVILQCGADGLLGDPLGGLKYTLATHRAVALALHRAAHRSCGGKLVALGGGGYDPDNCASAWLEVVRALREPPSRIK